MLPCKRVHGTLKAKSVTDALQLPFGWSLIRVCSCFSILSLFGSSAFQGTMSLRVQVPKDRVNAQSHYHDSKYRSRIRCVWVP